MIPVLERILSEVFYHKSALAYSTCLARFLFWVATFLVACSWQNTFSLSMGPIYLVSWSSPFFTLGFVKLSCKPVATVLKDRSKQSSSIILPRSLCCLLTFLPAMSQHVQAASIDCFLMLLFHSIEQTFRWLQDLVNCDFPLQEVPMCKMSEKFRREGKVKSSTLHGVTLSNQNSMYEKADDFS